MTKGRKEPDPGAPQPELGLSRSYQRGRCSCHQAGSQGCLQALVQGQEHGAPSSPHALPVPLGEWCTCCGPRGGENGVRAHLPHKVLDAAQLALDAGSVQQCLPHVIAPVPLGGHQRA